MTDFAFGQSFQDEMMALMVNDYGFALKVTKYISEDKLYSDSHKKIFSFFKKKIDSNNCMPSLLEIEDNLKREERSKRRLYKAFANKIYSLTPTDPEFLKTSLSEYAQKLLFVDAYLECQTLWNTGKHDKAFHYMYDGMNELFGVSFKDDINIGIEDFEEKRQIYIDEQNTKYKKFPTGINKLDEILLGGLAKTQLGIILADTKVGKSIGLIHIGCTTLAMRTGTVAHFVLEGTTEETIMRYQSRLTGIEHSRIVTDNLTKKERDKLDSIEKKFLNKLDLIPFNLEFEYTVRDIETKILEMTRKGKAPDVVIVDYGDLLSVEPSKKKMEFRHQQTDVFRGLKSLALIYAVALWTASQASRPKEETEKETLLRAKSISESYEKVRIADLLVTLNQTPREKAMGMMRILIDLYRHGQSDIVVKVLQDYSRMIFYSKIYGDINYMHRKSWRAKGRKK